MQPECVDWQRAGGGTLAIPAPRRLIHGSGLLKGICETLD